MQKDNAAFIIIILFYYFFKKKSLFYSKEGKYRKSVIIIKHNYSVVL